MRLKDIGLVLRDRITEHFQQRGTEITLKYIDPSYQIRSVPASPGDSVFCWNMARNAVHAAMAGNTEMLIGQWHGRFVHVPLPLATRFRKQVDVSEDLWMSVHRGDGPVGQLRDEDRRPGPQRRSTSASVATKNATDT